MTAPLYAPDWLRGITVKQPWAACIVDGDKRIENRPRAWSTGWRLLHAGGSVDRPALRDPLVARTIRGHHLHTSAVLAVVRITGCHTDPDDGPACSEWAQPGCFHLDLDDVHVLPLPVPCPGALGPWRVPRPVFEQVLLQLPHLTQLFPEVTS
ncbi:hypothetical protein J8N05_47135 (plasmid) [Streptomyces sp. BH-SS-21]|uniref:ASCH domain-containing protein n=1 Tax=Streptomyces liliiviolaceus TaxID=2823109 RepID=A0A940Y342_9ACTN|nr:hypothetical protein [Streptomyces liliiviolaceus]MBQ0855737.1 hypothetical protein [Streptomyces liliiviolaceus]